MGSVVLHDQDIVHWSMFPYAGTEGHRVRLELAWGKDNLADITINWDDIALVMVNDGEADNAIFSCRSLEGREVCRFTMAHSYKAGEGHTSSENN